MTDEPLDDVMAGVFEELRPSIEARVATVRRAAEALDQGDLDIQLATEAREEAHRLAGSLGTLGFRRGSEAARTAETLLTDPPTADVGRLLTAVQELRAVVRR